MVYNLLKRAGPKPRKSAIGTLIVTPSAMGKKFLRLFVIKNRFEACAVIYALAVGAISRGMQYLEVYPGFAGWLLMIVCPIAVLMAGARLMELTRKDSGQRRRKSDFPPPGGLSEAGTPA